MPLAPGATFERYVIETLVGRGGMGEVYQATDTRLNRTVALKVIRSDKDGGDLAEIGGVQRLLREARAAAAFNHPNSVAVYELGEAEGIPYIAMEFVAGKPLRAYVGDRSVSMETKLEWLVDAARALWAAHRAGLIHRDVKPGNIMVSGDGVVKVLDFGLAKTTKVDPAGFQTLMGQVLGTPRYMAPEQLADGATDARCDQFSFGVTAYELLSGIYPGDAQRSLAPPLDGLGFGIPTQLSRVIVRMMELAPKDRFPTMEEAAHALRACLPAVRVALAASAVRRGAAGNRSDEPPTETVAPPTRREDVASGSVPIDAPVPIKTVPLAAAVGEEVQRRVALESGGSSGTSVPRGAQASAPPADMRTLPIGHGARAWTTRGTPMTPHPSGIPRAAATPQAPVTPQPFPSARASRPTPTPTGVASGVFTSSSAASSSAQALGAGRPLAAKNTRTPPVWIALLAAVAVVAIAGGILAALLVR